MKELLKKYFKHLAFFYRYLGLKIVWVLLLSITVGILDGFGLAMFLPLLELVSGANESSKEGLGGMAFLVEWFEIIGFKLNLYTVLTFLVILFSLKGVLTFVRNYYDTASRFFFMKKLRLSLSELLAGYSYKSFSTANVGQIQNSMTGELAKLGNALRSYLQTMQAYVMVMVYATLAAISNFQFAVIVAIGVIVTNLFYKIIYKKTTASSGQLTRKDSLYHGFLIQFVNSFKYLKATGYINSYKQKLNKAIIAVEEENRRLGFYVALLGALREPIMVIVVCGVIVFQTLVLSAPLGGIILSLLFFYRAMTNIVLLQTIWNNFLVHIGAIESIQVFMSDLKEKQEPNGTLQLEGNIQEWNMNNVSFAFADKKVINSVSLKIKRNTTVAFVGQSGSGKTTLVNILCALYYTDSGNVTVNGHELRSLNRNGYQNQIGYITQEPVIYDDTLYNNVTFWAEKTESNLRRFFTVVEQAAVSDFMEQMSDKEDSRLGNNGVQLSGGQKQRISIARELYKEVQLLVMDEATSALDSETEKVIQSNIDRLKGKLTIVIVAHRLSTIKGADQVLVMSEGKIIENGSYDELLERSATFQKMVNLQEL